MKYQCNICNEGYELSDWKTYTLTGEDIVGGSYTMPIECPKGHKI